MTPFILAALIIAVLAMALFRSFLPVLRSGPLAPLLMVGSAIVPPANSIYAGGSRYDQAVQTYRIGASAANLRAGVFVIQGATDDVVIAAGADAAGVIGVLTERNWTNPLWDPATAPAVGDEFDVLLVGSGAWAKVRNGANLASGVRVSTSATGRAAAAGVNTVARTLHASNGSGAETDVVVVL